MKKILALLLVLCMTLCLFNVPATVYAAESDGELLVTETQLDIIEYLDIMTKSYVTKWPHNNVTRAGAAYYFQRFSPEIKNSPTPGVFEAIYKDVTSEHTYYRQIKAVKEAGVMNGYPDGTFRPDEQITVKEAAKVFLYMLGYKEYIGIFGLEKAIKISEICDGLEGIEKLQSHQFVRMMWNALHAPTIEMTGITSDGAILEYDEDNTGMKKLYGIDIRKGVVDGVPGTTLLTVDHALNENELYIDDEKYIYNNEEKYGNAKELLGYSVEFYVKEQSGGREEILFMFKSDKNEELVLQSEDIEDFSNLTYTYWVGNKSKKISFTDDAAVIYNGVAAPMCSDEESVPDYGTVTLISNDGKKGYEVVKIDSYEFYLVDNIDVNNEVIYDVTEGVKLDLSTADEYSIKLSGYDYPFERLIHGDFLVVRKTDPGCGYYFAEIIVRKDERPYTEVETFSVANRTMRGGGKDYSLWSGLSEESKAALENGAIVALYFSIDGTVVRIEKGTVGDSDYGYLITVAKDGILEEKISFRLVDNKSGVAAYGMGKTLKIDGESFRNFDEISAMLASTASMYPEPYYNAEYPYAQPVKYALTETGLLKSIDTINHNSAKEDEENALRLDVTGSYTMRNQNTTLYDKSNYLVASIGKNTSKLQIPLNVRNEEENYSVLTWADGEVMTNELLFNIDENIHIADAIYHFEDISTTARVKYNVRPVIVKEKLVELDAENEVVYKINCYSEKEEVTYTLHERDAANVDVGDMIRVELNVDNSVKEGRIELVFDASEGKFADSPYKDADGKMFSFQSSSRNPFTMGYKAFYVMPVYTQDNFMSITTSVPSDGDSFRPNQQYNTDNVTLTNAKYYKYSNIRGVEQVQPASIADISLYSVNPSTPSEMVLTIYGNGVDYIYIIEHED